MELLPGLNRALRRVLVLRGVTSAEIGIEGFPVHYYELRGDGRGPPIVLVHGLGGSANGFYKLLFGLSKRFSRVLAPDLPGNGFSPLPEGQRGLSAHRQLEVLSGFIERVAAEPSLVVGTSLGGAMCILLAHNRPEQVKALALIAPAGARVAEERIASLIQSFDVKTNSQARELTRRLFHKAPVGALLLASEMRKVYGAEAVRAVLSEVKSDDFIDPEVLRGLRVPTLLIWGESEKLLPYESIDFFRQHLPDNAEIHVVPRFGHVPQMERPAEVLQELVSFADRAGL